MKNVKIEIELLADIFDSLKFYEEKKLWESIKVHIIEQCSDFEKESLLERCMSLDVKQYHTIEEFMDDYQPILDIVDFSISDALQHFNKHKLDYDKI